MSSEQLADRLRSFLLKKPRPEIVRVRTNNGESREVHVEEGRVRWSDVAKTVAALDPVTVTALTSDETVLRVDTIKAGDVPNNDKGDAATKMPLHSDPLTAQLHHFGSLLADAYKFANETAFNKLSDMWQAQTAQHEATQKRLERMETQYMSEFEARIRERLDHMDNGDEKDKMIEAFFRGASGEKPGGQQQPRRSSGNNGRPTDWRQPDGWGDN